MSARSPWLAVYGLLVRSILTRARAVSMLLLALSGIVVAAVVGANVRADVVAAGTDLINEFGLWLLVPVPTLLFASAAFGDLNDDKTLVYLWLRPVPRWQLVTAAFAAALTVSWPLVVPPLVVAASLTGAGTDLVVATAVAATVLTVAYVGIFGALGLRVRRPLAWGLAYIVIWEGFVARGSATASKIGMRAYGSSILRDATGVDLLTSEIDPTWAVVVPPLAFVAATAYASWRLARQDVA